MEAKEFALLFPLRNESCDTLTQNNIDYAVELIEEDRKEQRKIGREEAEKQAFDVLNFFGIPKERAVTIENGIQVLQRRMEKEISLLKQTYNGLFDAYKQLEEQEEKRSSTIRDRAYNQGKEEEARRYQALVEAVSILKRSACQYCEESCEGCCYYPLRKALSDLKEQEE